MNKKIISLFTILSFIFSTFTVLASEPQIEISENANISLFSGVLNTDELPVLNNNEAENIISLENGISKPATINAIEKKLKINDYRLRNHVTESDVELNEPQENIQAYASGISSRTVLPNHSEYRLDNINGKDSYALQNQTGRTIFVGDNLGTEYIDPLTGNLVITETDLVLPGVDGLDLKIERYYSSSEAEVYTKTAGIETQSVGFIMQEDMYLVTETVTDTDNGAVSTYKYPYATQEEAIIRKSEIESRDTCDGRYTYSAEITTTSEGEEISLDYYYTSELASASYQRAKSNLGAGWSWSFPSVQVVKDNHSDASEVAYGLYYHDGKGNVIEVLQTGDNIHGDFEFANYTGGDIEFDGVFEYMPEIDASARIDYKVTDAEETEYYFGPYGEIRVIRDRYGNRINFYYTTKNFYGIGNFPVINSITDTVGRRVWFEYGPSEIIDEKEYETLTLTIEEPGNSANNLTLTYKKQMLTDNDVSLSKEPALVSFTNSIGQTTQYLAATTGNENDDLFTPFYFTFADKRLDSTYVYNTSGISQNATYLLGAILRPYSMSAYNYERCTRNLGHSGVAEAFRISERYDYELNVNSSDKVITNYTKNYKAYSYGDEDGDEDEDYTGYPYYHSISAIPDRTPVCYVTEQQNGILRSREYYKIANTILLKSEGTTYTNPVGEPLYVSQVVEEFSGKYPLKTKITYGNGDYSYNSYVYSEYADGYYNKAQGKPLAITKEIDREVLLNENYEKYITRYEYNDSGFLTQKMWYQDEDIPVYETYTYTDKRISSLTNADDVETSYTHEYTDGKVSKKTTQSYNNGETLTIEEYYTPQTSYAFPSTIKKIVTANGATKTDITTYTYDMLLGVVTSETDTNGNTTYYEYDDLGRVTKIIYPPYSTYDSINTKNTRILPIQEINYGTARLSDYSNISDEYTPLQVQEIQKTTLYYNITGIQGTLPTDAELANCSLTYVADEINYYMGTGEHIRNETLDTINNTNTYITTDYFYDDYYNSITVIDAQGNETATYYDGLGREVKIEDIFDNYQITEYNIDGDSVGFKSMSYFVPCDNRNTKENISVNTYDRWGRVLNTKAYEEYPQKYVETKYTCDIEGNILGIIDPKGTKNNDGYTVSYTYDRLNRVKTTKNAKNEVIENYYDNYGNITEQYISYDKNSKRLYVREYDGEGKLISDKDNSNNKNIYTYNNQGQLVTTVDKNDRTTHTGYNELNILDTSYTVISGVSMVKDDYQILNPVGASAVIRFNGQYDEDIDKYSGLVTEVTTNTFSPTGKLLTKETDYAYSTGYSGVYFHPYSTYTYDDYGNIVSSVFSCIDENTNTMWANTHHYEYDKNRISKVQLGGSEKNTDDSKNVKYEFYNDGKLKSVTFPNLTDGSTLKSEYVYDGLSRLKTLTNKKGNTVLSSYSYTYDDNGNILTVAETVNGAQKNTAYTYDELNRIASVIGDKGADSYYEYDYRGNRKVNFEEIDFLSEETAEYRYNEFDKLYYSKTGNDTVNIAYSADGYRFVKQENTDMPIYYIYDESGRLMAENALVVTTIDGVSTVIMAPITQYIWGPDKALAKKDLLSGADYYYLYNGHGDVVQIVDTAGNIVNNYDYDVWGNFITKQEPIDNPFTYFGQTYDETTGLYYLRARYYDPQTGRFTQQDPAEDGYNWYVYGNQNPVLYADYSGYSGQTVDLGNGWYYRIDPADTSTKTQRHIHIYNSKKQYIQNEDGSTHDKKNNSKGDPPSKVLKKINELENWDYKEKKENFFNNVTLEYMDYGVLITYPDGFQILQKNSIYNMGIVTEKNIQDYYYDGSTSESASTSQVYVVPIINFTITIPSFSFGFFPALGF